MDADGGGRRAADGKSAATDLRSSGIGALLGWIVVELVGYGLLVAFASDQQSSTCTGLCFTERDLFIFLGLAFGLWILPGQLVLGLVLTAGYRRGGMSPFGAGTTAFFATVVAAACVIGVIIAAQQ
jgi:hypothetical protein